MRRGLPAIQNLQITTYKLFSNCLLAKYKLKLITKYWIKVSTLDKSLQTPCKSLQWIKVSTLGKGLRTE